MKMANQKHCRAKDQSGTACFLKKKLMASRKVLVGAVVPEGTIVGNFQKNRIPEIVMVVLLNHIETVGILNGKPELCFGCGISWSKGGKI